ncbi:MAG: hypothetical protein A3F40_01115 [Chlamydiae bacterium RIFCSPHIGHO2_12_FULL_27_8]|nr:MAG: hypothetical protein A3F40_01115 [Chlamydiae bacterium RIFCSPHIGHO2_12_FULL_27_8]OGN65425.1 MAG: hypothetical protein A2888_02020 [Chlamydiae bacterium RIFCSPLOWO2_01_FULL_28_7]
MPIHRTRGTGRGSEHGSGYGSVDSDGVRYSSVRDPKTGESKPCSLERQPDESESAYYTRLTKAKTSVLDGRQSSAEIYGAGSSYGAGSTYRTDRKVEALRSRSFGNDCCCCSIL